MTLSSRFRKGSWTLQSFSTTITWTWLTGLATITWQLPWERKFTSGMLVRNLSRKPLIGSLSLLLSTSLLSGTGDIQQLMELEGADDYVCSVKWIKDGNCLAVGNSRGEVALWDVGQVKRIRLMQGHSDRVGSLSWNEVRCSVDHYIWNQSQFIASFSTSFPVGAGLASSITVMWGLPIIWCNQSMLMLKR